MIECFLKISNKKIRKWRRTIKALFFSIVINPNNISECLKLIDKLQDKIAKETSLIMDAHFKLQSLENKNNKK